MKKNVNKWHTKSHLNDNNKPFGSLNCKMARVDIVLHSLFVSMHWQQVSVWTLWIQCLFFHSHECWHCSLSLMASKRRMNTHGIMKRFNLLHNYTDLIHISNLSICNVESCKHQNNKKLHEKECPNFWLMFIPKTAPEYSCVATKHILAIKNNIWNIALQCPSTHTHTPVTTKTKIKVLKALKHVIQYFTL